MKIYVSHSRSYDFKNELYLPIRNSPLNSKHKILLPHEESNKPFNSRKYLRTCDLVIAEVSYPSTGQGMELGWANLYEIPTICIFKEGHKPSSSLKIITDKFCEYKDPKDMIEELEKIISRL